MKNKILIIIVGKSGAGKSTFCKAMDCNENWFVSSKLMKKELEKQGKEITHDSIHKFAVKAYSKNPEWQIPKILKAMEGKDFLILDGPRIIKEVKALKEKIPATLIIKIKANNRKRAERLEERDGTQEEDFKRIEEDENGETQLRDIFKMVSLTINNEGPLEQLQDKAKRFKEFLINIK